MSGRMKTLDDSKNEFVSNVSHELKTPLTSMKVLADSLLLQEDAPVELIKNLWETCQKRSNVRIRSLMICYRW